MWTKGQIVSSALAELGLQGYEFDISSAEKADALRRLDSMMATWEALGIHIGYAMPSDPKGSDDQEDCGLPDSAVETVFLNLAVRLAPGYGKQVSTDTRRSARQGYDVLLLEPAKPSPQQQPSTMPRGAGGKPWGVADRPFFPAPRRDPLGIAPGGDLDLSE